MNQQEERPIDRIYGLYLKGKKEDKAPQGYIDYFKVRKLLLDEIDLALANRDKEIVKKLVSYFDKKHYCLNSECKINKEQSDIINLITNK